MEKLDRPTGLIAYDTDMNIKRRQAGETAIVKWLRMRTLLYAAVIAVVGGVMLFVLATRDSEGISVIHDRNPMYVRLSDGALRNAYTIRIVNKQLKYRDFILSVDGLPSTLIDFVGLPPRSDGRQLVSVGPDQTKEVRVTVTDYSPRRRRHRPASCSSSSTLIPARSPRCATISSVRERGLTCAFDREKPRELTGRHVLDLADRILRLGVPRQRRDGAGRDFDLRRRRNQEFL